jgi:hypothetical protein
LYKALYQSLENDLNNIIKICPKPVLPLLKTFPIFINNELWFGLKSNPTRGRGMCYHPEARWLKKRGNDPGKERSVEIFRVNNFFCSLFFFEHLRINYVPQEGAHQRVLLQIPPSFVKIWKILLKISLEKKTRRGIYKRDICSDTYEP